MDKKHRDNDNYFHFWGNYPFKKVNTSQGYSTLLCKYYSIIQFNDVLADYVQNSIQKYLNVLLLVLCKMMNDYLHQRGQKANILICNINAYCFTY